MKRIFLLSATVFFAIFAMAQTQVKVTVNGHQFVASVENTATGNAFVQKLPLTLTMSELNGNEKYAYGVQLPTASQYFGVVNAGDLLLYGSNCLVLFYGEAGGFSYTRVGRLLSVEGLAQACGNGDATVSFELDDPTGVTDINAERHHSGIYSLSGQRLREEPESGIFIKNGKKVIK